jgi:integrase
MSKLIAAYEAHMRAAGFAVNTIEDRVKYLVRIDAELPCGLAYATTEELADKLANPAYSRATRATYYGHVRGFYAYHADPRRPVGLDWDPSAGLTRPRVPQGLPRPVTDAELRHALEHAREPWRTYVLLAAYGGLRSFEIVRQTREEITGGKSGTITILDGKGGKARVVPTYPLVWGAVENLPRGLLAQPSSSGRLDADFMSSETARYIRKRLDLPGFTLHRCRHWYATMLLRPRSLGGAGADLRAVQQLMGHSSPATTAIYTLVTDEQRRIAVAALPALAPSPL